MISAVLALKGPLKAEALTGPLKAGESMKQALRWGQAVHVQALCTLNAHDTRVELLALVA